MAKMQKQYTTKMQLPSMAVMYLNALLLMVFCKLNAAPTKYPIVVSPK